MATTYACVCAKLFQCLQSFTKVSIDGNFEWAESRWTLMHQHGAIWTQCSTDARSTFAWLNEYSTEKFISWPTFAKVESKYMLAAPIMSVLSSWFWMFWNIQIQWNISYLLQKIKCLEMELFQTNRMSSQTHKEKLPSIFSWLAQGENTGPKVIYDGRFVKRLLKREPLFCKVSHHQWWYFSLYILTDKMVCFNPLKMLPQF